MQIGVFNNIVLIKVDYANFCNISVLIRLLHLFEGVMQHFPYIVLVS